MAKFTCWENYFLLLLVYWLAKHASSETAFRAWPDKRANYVFFHGSIPSCVQKLKNFITWRTFKIRLDELVRLNPISSFCFGKCLPSYHSRNFYVSSWTWQWNFSPVQISTRRKKKQQSNERISDITYVSNQLLKNLANSLEFPWMPWICEIFHYLFFFLLRTMSFYSYFFNNFLIFGYLRISQISQCVRWKNARNKKINVKSLHVGNFTFRWLQKLYRRLNLS